MQKARQPIALDLETKLFGLEHGTLPPPICYSLAWREGDAYATWLFAHVDDGLEGHLQALLLNDDVELWFVNAPYDLGTIHEHHPRLRAAIYAAYDAGRVRDAALESMLHRVAEYGQLGQHEDKLTGESEKVRYSLAAMMMANFGEDRSAEKDDPNGIRLRYAELEGLPVAQYPEDFRAYALQDAVDTLRLAEFLKATHDPPPTYALHAAADFALRLYANPGLQLDPERTRALAARVAEERQDERHPGLIQAGILVPAQPEQEIVARRVKHAKGCPKVDCDCPVTVTHVRAHVQGCPRKKRKGEWLCDCPNKLKAAQPARISEEPLHKRVLAVATAREFTVELTDKGREVMKEATGHDVEKLRPESWYDPLYPTLRHEKTGRPLYVKCAGISLNELAVADPVLYEYRHRKKLDKLVQSLRVATEALEAGYPRVHTNYHPLKETGRVSAYGHKKDIPLGEGRNPYPAKNLMQEPNPPKVAVDGLEFLDDLDVRRQYTPAPGNVFINADFASLELVTLAQVMYTLFEVPHGISCRHRELLNSGRSPHTYLGAQILFEHGEARDPGAQRFKALSEVRRAARLGDRMAIGDHFAKWKKGEADERRVFKQYRTTAKPVGLGYPGMLGARKMAFGIAPQYNLDMTQADAEAFKRVWLDSYPEMQEWRRFVSRELLDPEHPGRYRYTSRLGYTRVNCSFNAAANGLGMQTPGAEAAKLAVYMILKACYDPTAGSILLGRFVPNLFMHDEIMGEAPEDSLLHYAVVEVGQIMERALKIVCPDVDGQAEPCATRLWNKGAEPVFDSLGFHVPWEPDTVDA